MLAVEGNRPAAQIVAVAGRIAADFIVLGTHGRSGFERLVLGSVAENWWHGASVRVITVPPPMVATSRLPFRQVLCGIDFSEPSMVALDSRCRWRLSRTRR